MAFQCPYCQTAAPPVRDSRISTGGWVVFAILVFLCLPLCWIGLLMKEDYTTCRDCGIKLG